jgi:uncharacterized lipoprotein YmbA
MVPSASSAFCAYRILSVESLPASSEISVFHANQIYQASKLVRHLQVAAMGISPGVVYRIVDARIAEARERRPVAMIQVQVSLY